MYETQANIVVTTLEAVLLGIVQGLTEFLPISSSGHLVVIESIMGRGGRDATFEIFLHFGTLLAVCIFFRSVLLDMMYVTARNLPLVIKPRRFLRATTREPSLALLVAICFGTIPAGVVGLAWGDRLEALFDEPRIASVFLLVTACILLSTKWSTDRGKHVSPLSSFIIGLAQAFAILPGISRSGATITAALHMGISREEGARFSFLLALPAILGAVVLKSASLLSGLDAEVSISALALGTLCAFCAGYLSIAVLLRIIHHRRFHLFAYYCFVAGLVGLMLFS